jgi:hypothetical protein
MALGRVRISLPVDRPARASTRASTSALGGVHLKHQQVGVRSKEQKATRVGPGCQRLLIGLLSQKRGGHPESGADDRSVNDVKGA